MEQPLVSVLMSVYNGDQWLQKAIDSIVAQTYTNWQVVITNDGSTDGTTGILNQYINNSKFIIINRQPNQGYVKAFNNALPLCNGKYIARFDADDINLPERFEQQVNYLEKHGEVSMVAAFINFIDEEDQAKGQWNDDRQKTTYRQIRWIIPFRNCIAHPSVMIHSEVLKRYKYNELQTNSEDWDLWMQLCADGLIIEKITTPLLNYRVHTKSVTAHSLKKSVFKKNHFTYKQYLKQAVKNRRFNFFNAQVLLAFALNYIKLVLSNIKRSFTHNK